MSLMYDLVKHLLKLVVFPWSFLPGHVSQQSIWPSWLRLPNKKMLALHNATYKASLSEEFWSAVSVQQHVQLMSRQCPWMLGDLIYMIERLGSVSKFWASQKKLSKPLQQFELGNLTCLESPRFARLEPT